MTTVQMSPVCPTIWTGLRSGKPSGTDPEKGALCVKTFHFRLEVVSDEEGQHFLEATDYVENPWPDGRDPESSHSFRSSFDPEGLEEIKKWLASEESAALNQSE